jgi:hypothetical protein
MQQPPLARQLQPADGSTSTDCYSTAGPYPTGPSRVACSSIETPCSPPLQMDGPVCAPAAGAAYYFATSLCLGDAFKVAGPSADDQQPDCPYSLECC